MPAMVGYLNHWATAALADVRQKLRCIGKSFGDLRFLPFNFDVNLGPLLYTSTQCVDLSRERNDLSSFKKYKCLTISEKKKVIESVEEVERKVDVAKAFEIPLSSLSTILKNKEKIFSASSSRVRKRVSKGNFPRLEQSLIPWMRQCRGKNIPMGGSLLKEKAKAFAKVLGIEFSASEG
ncbi:uncharacterized protein TNCV_3268051 [Trichonephila clavipes]|nr:uncharacterized protein TNCV_3268051 [Trichonephila clavipes]